MRYEEVSWSQRNPIVSGVRRYELDFGGDSGARVIY